MKLNKNILALDYVGQSILIGGALVSVVSAAVFPSAILFTMILGFVIGCWQVFSALVIAIFTASRERLYYLLAVVAFFTNATIISYFWRDYVFEYGIIIGIVWGLIPAIYAFWYYKITYSTFEKLKKEANTSEFLYNEKEFVQSQ